MAEAAVTGAVVVMAALGTGVDFFGAGYDADVECIENPPGELALGALTGTDPSLNTGVRGEPELAEEGSFGIVNPTLRGEFRG